MRKLAEKRWARVIAVVLFSVFLVLSAAASVLVQYGRNDGWYRPGANMGFENTRSCLNYVNDANRYVEQNVRWLEDMSLDYLGAYAGSAYAYRIVDTEGSILADTTTEKSVFVVDNGFVPVPEPGFTVQGFVNLPVEPYGGCYAEYATFEAFFGVRYLMLTLKILFLFLAGTMLLILCFGAAKRGREGHLAGALKKPYDLILICAAAAFFILIELKNSLMDSFMQAFIEYTGTWPSGVYGAMYDGISYVFNLLIAAFLLWNLSGQLGAGILSKNLLCRKLLKRMPQPVCILAFFLVHAILLGVSFNGYYGYSQVTGSLLLLIDVVAAAALIGYVVQANRIHQAAKELADGNLSYKTDTKKLHFIWKKIGESLNSIGDGMTRAVADRMRSERMKTELITNVSHDLKTPLTSVINYVDLLKTDELTPEERAEYLDILDKQSARLKKLTEDVLEASKAASGAMTVTEETIDTVELVEQFLGEYAGRFETAGVEPVLTAPENAPKVRADSVLLGRVIDNLITNVVKYAQAGTRAYIDLCVNGEGVYLTIKNISREPLNISAEELMERFVRGDSSRHSEGSGLGLSIARSLTELMGGRLSIHLDGDLFKAEIKLPAIIDEVTKEHGKSAVI